MIKRILVGVAGTPALEAKIASTIDLAKRHKAEVSVLSVVDVDRLSDVGPVPIGAGKYAQDMRHDRIETSHKLDDDAISKFEAACAEASVPLSVIRQEGKPMDVLMAAWRYHDFCVLGARGWFDYRVLPEPRDALLHIVEHGVCPILAVTEEARPVRKILIAYNGSLESAKTMKQFVQMSLWKDLEVHIVCVGEPDSDWSAETVLDQAQNYCRLHGIEATVSKVEGAFQEVILSYASAMAADLIVLGSSFRRVLLRRSFGENALGLIKTSNIPLFLSH